MLLPWQAAVVEKVLEATPNTRRYLLRLPETPRFDFVPCQFVTLDLPIHEKRNKRWRSYSIASAPDGSNAFELVVVKAEPSTGGSEYIWNHWQEGTETLLRGPQGVFTLPAPLPEERVFFICTGTGIAPFRSMLHHWAARGGFPSGGVTLLFGCRTQADLLYAAEMQAFEQHFPGFSYLPVLSREDWKGLRGYVHPVYEKLCAERPPALFMLCGWKGMVDEAVARIRALGYDKAHIRLELYG